jgi:L-ascorbate metabolism protein UlaG (beta-lactamase superfamily)
MYLLLLLLLLPFPLYFLFIQQAQYGKLPSGARLLRIQKSPHYKNGAFQNLSPTPTFTGDANVLIVLYEFIFKRNKNNTPSIIIPSSKTALDQLNANQDSLIWFGHSSYYMLLEGQHLLVDPVFSGHASPFTTSVKAFKGADQYTANDFKTIDVLFLTHDHWDHLDYQTIKQLQPKIKHIVCGLGTAAHLEHWGFNPAMISELDWQEEVILPNQFKVTATPARHFSGRTFKRNQAIWASFVLQSATKKIFIGGDSGFDSHFQAIGKQHGPFDLAILENGQYDWKWSSIHTLPNELVPTAMALKAKQVLAVHSSKFALGNHDWDEPLRLAKANFEKSDIHLITPMIGETVDLNQLKKHYSEWWKV